MAPLILLSNAFHCFSTAVKSRFSNTLLVAFFVNFNSCIFVSIAFDNSRERAPNQHNIKYSQQNFFHPLRFNFPRAEFMQVRFISLFLEFKLFGSINKKSLLVISFMVAIQEAIGAWNCRINCWHKDWKKL